MEGKYAYGISISCLLMCNELPQMLLAYSHTSVYVLQGEKAWWVQLDSLLRISQGQNHGVSWAGL